MHLLPVLVVVPAVVAAAAVVVVVVLVLLDGADTSFCSSVLQLAAVPGLPLALPARMPSAVASSDSGLR